jgi:predicted HTH domain antitoxin
VRAKAEQEGVQIDQIESEIPPQDFERQINQLYTRWNSGEFSFGRFAELIGLSHWELWEILEACELPII